MATLDTPIPQGKNAIWCASFQAAWKALEKDLAGGPVALDGAREFTAALNRAADPRPFIPEEALYVASGFNRTGLLEKISADLKQRFPHKAPPTFPGIVPNSFLTYAYLEAKVVFPIPYYQNPAPLQFVDAEGKSNQVCSFGLLSENLKDSKQRAQPRVLFSPEDPGSSNRDFAIDLWASSSPSQIVVASIGREPTLEAAVDRVEFSSRPASARSVGSGTLFVPEMRWAIAHAIFQIQKKRFLNPSLAGQSVDVARQEISFSLDKSGAAVKSQMDAYAGGIPEHFVFDRPFLVYMKRRGAELPYFAMWVDNAELLHAWPAAAQHGR